MHNCHFLSKINFTIVLFFICLYASAQPLFWFIENKQTGYKDSKGTTVIKPQFAMSGNFVNGITYAGTGENQFAAKYGFINAEGKWIIQPQYEAADDFAEDKARVLQNGKWGYVNSTGKMMIAPQFRLCFSFTNGHAKATAAKNLWGLIDATGKFVIEPAYYDLTDIGKEGVLAVKKTVSSKWQLVNIKNEVVSKNEFGLVYNFVDGLAAARDENDKWGFINTAGEWVIQPTYSHAFSFSEGLAAVEKDFANWGFIDKTNKLVIEPTYDRQSIFINGFARVEKGNEYMYIDKLGKVILRFGK